MSQYNTNVDELQNENSFRTKLPQGLNILTILTIVWCSISTIFTILMPWFLKLMSKLMEKTTNSTELSAKKLEDVVKSRHSFELLQANLTPLLIIGLIGIVLCFVGAIWMRNYKKDGFWLYVAGQVLPFIGGLILLGIDQYNGVVSYLFAAIPFLFIFLYWKQKKYLIK